MKDETLHSGDAYIWQGYRFVIILGIWHVSGATEKRETAATFSSYGNGVNVGGFNRKEEIARARIWEAK